MASENQIINVSIRKATVFPALQSFNVTCLLAVHALWPDTLKSISGTSDLDALSVPVYHPVYKAAQAYFGQPGPPPQLIIYKRALKFTQAYTLMPLNTTAGFVYSFNVQDLNTGINYPISYTVLSSATTSTVATALAALIAGVPSLSTASASTGTITATNGTAGNMVEFSGLPPISVMKLLCTTADPGIATELQSLKVATGLAGSGFSWYGFSFDHGGGKASQAAAAAFSQANINFFFSRCSDSECTDNTITNDLGSMLTTAEYTRCASLFAQDATSDYCEMAWQAAVFPLPPGSATWAFKNLSGINVNLLQESEATTLETKNMSDYRPLDSVGQTYQGNTPDGDFIDITIGIDYVSAQIQIAWLNALGALPKVPMTNAGILLVRQAIQKVLDQAVPAIFSPDAPPKCIVPDISAVSETDRKARILNGITFTARLTGAIHRSKVLGTVGY